MVGMIRYEIKKLFQQRIILLLLVLSTLLMAVMLLKSESFEKYSWDESDKAVWHEYLSATSKMEYKEAQKWLKEEHDKERQMLRELHGTEGYVIKIHALSRLLEHFEYLASYNSYVDKTLNQAKMVQTVSFYSDNAFALSDAARVESDYSRLTDIEVSRNAALFVEAVTAFDTADYILLFQMMMFVVLVFGFEDENVKRLLRVQNKGRGHVFGAKILALMCVSAVLVLITYLYLMIIGFLYFGEGVFDVPLQSLANFKTSKYHVTVGGFLLLFSIFKIVAAWIFVFIFSLCNIVAGNVSGSILSISISAVFYVAYLRLDGRKLLSPLKYINPAAWFDVNGWISEYANINFFTKAIPFEVPFAVGAVVLTVVLPLLSLRCYTKERNGGRVTVFKRLQSFLTGLFEKFIERISIVFHEIYRFFAEGFQWLLIGILIAVSVLIISNIVRDSEYDNVAYLYHLESIEAEYADETIDYLEKYMSYLRETDGYREGLVAKYTSGEISQKEYELALNDLESDKQTIKGFEILYNQGKYLMRRNEAGVENLGFVDKEWSDRVLSNKFYMVILELLFACTMFVVFGRYLLSDYNVFGLIKSTYRGRRENHCMKILNLLLCALLIAVPSLVVYYTIIFKGYEPEMFDFGIRSIDMYALCDSDISVKNMFIISMIFKYVGIVCIGLFMYFLSLFHLPKAVFQIIVLFAVVMPPAIEVMGAPIDFLGFSGFFYAEQLFKRGMSVVIIYPAVIFILLLVFGFFAVRHYRGKQKDGKVKANGQHS